MQFSFTPYTFRPFNSTALKHQTTQLQQLQQESSSIFALYSMDADPWADAPSSPPRANASLPPASPAHSPAPLSPVAAAKATLSPVKPTPPDVRATPVKSSSVNVKAMISQLNAGASTPPATGKKGKGKGKKGKGKNAPVEPPAEAQSSTSPTEEPVEPVEPVESVEPAQSAESVELGLPAEVESVEPASPEPVAPTEPEPATEQTPSPPITSTSPPSHDLDDSGDIGVSSHSGDIGMSSPKPATPPASLPPASPVKSPLASPTKTASPVVQSTSDIQPEPALGGADPYSFTTPVDTYGSSAFGGDDGDAFDDTSFAVGDLSAALPKVPAFSDSNAFTDMDAFAAPDASTPAFALAPPPAPNASDEIDDGFNDAAFDGADNDDGFDDFDDFDAPAATFEDDGFGDFGEFEEGDGEAAPEVAPVVTSPPVAPLVDWTALSLRPVPPRGELLSRVSVVLEPLVPSSEHFTDEPPRAVGGLAQVLATESSRDTYAQLTTPPMLKPLDWTRSRVRRDHLISMGVPVNLDEVDSHRLSTLPPLQITTAFPRSQSVDPERLQRNSMGMRVPVDNNGPASAAPALAGTDGEGKYGLGGRPHLDNALAEELCGLDEEQLSLLPLSKLEQLHSDFTAQTADASALLAWLVQLKDAQTQDSATYNGMISEMIANAAKVKGGSTGGGGIFRRNSQKPAASKSRPASMSANATPRRVGSPGVF